MGRKLLTAYFTSRFSSFIILVINILIATAGSYAFATSGITYHGRIVKPDGSAINGNVDFKLQIRSPGANNCLMYEEVQTKTLADGIFVIGIGDGTTTPSFNVASLTAIFDNTQPFTFTGASACNLTNSYNPTSGDGRNLQVYFREAGATSWEPMPLSTINFVPMALQAIQAEQVGKYTPSSLLRVDNAGTPGTASAFTSAQFTELQNLIAGTSTQYTPETVGAGTEVKVISGAASAPVTGSLWLDSSSGQLKFYDGSSVKTIGSGTSAAGTVTAITAGTGLSGGTITTSGTISIAPGGVSSTELASNSVTSSKIVDGTIVSADLSPSISISTTGSITASGAITSAGNIIGAGLSTGGALSVAGNSTILGNEAVSGNIGSNSLSTRTIYLSNLTGSTLSLSVPTVAFTNFGLTLPSADGTSGQVLKTDGSGHLGWVNSATGAGDFFKDGSVPMTGALQMQSNAVSSTGVLNFNSDSDGAGSDGGFNFKVNGSSKMTVNNSGDLTLASTTNAWTTSGQSLNLAGGLGVVGNIVGGGIVSGAQISGGGVNNTTYVSSSTSERMPGITGTDGGVVQAGNNNNADGTGAYLRINALNTANKSQGFYIGSIANTGASVYTPTVVFGQQTGATSYNERMRLDANGNLGIGTVSPSASLDVAKSVRVGTTLSFAGSTSGTVGFQAPAVAGNTLWTLPSTDGSSGQVLSTNGSGILSWATASGGGLSASTAFVNGGNSFGAGASLGTKDSNALTFITNNSSRMTIDSSGNIGIGASAPAGILTVSGGTASAGTNGTNITLTAQSGGTGTTNGGYILLYPGAASGGGTPGSVGVGTVPAAWATANSVVANGDLWAWNGSVQINNAGMYYNGGWNQGLSWGSTSWIRGNLLGLDAVGIGTSGSERLRILPSGNVGIGTSTPSTMLEVAGSTKISGTLSLAGATSGTVAFKAPSVSNNVLWTLPSSDGTNGQVLATNGSGTLSWTANGTSLSGTSQYFGDGTSAAPSISFANDTDTGIFRPGNNILGFATGGTERMRIGSLGNIEIGNSTGIGGYSEVKAIQIADTPVSATVVGNYVAGPITGGWFSGVANQTLFGQNMAIAGYGNYKSVSGSGTNWAGIELNSGAINFYTNNSGSTNWANISPTSRMYISTAGSVGIGNTNPQASLDVSGAVKVGTTLTLSGSTSGTVGLKAPATSGNVVWTMPSTDGTSGQAMVTNGSGTLSWGSLSTGLSGATVKFGDGALASPSITFANDTTTGLWRPGTSTIAVSTGGNERLRIDSSGNVGIGTSSPTAKLDIQGGAIRSTYSGGSSYANSSAAVDWSRGNNQSISVDCATTTFTNMLDGATYNLAVTDLTTSTCVFSQAGLTFYYAPANGARVNGQPTMYSFTRIGSNVYVSWSTMSP